MRAELLKPTEHAHGGHHHLIQYLSPPAVSLQLDVFSQDSLPEIQHLAAKCFCGGVPAYTDDDP